MRKASFLFPLVLVVFALSCKTADDRVPEIAADFCNCFNKLESDLSKQTVDLITTASYKSDPQAAMESELGKLADDDKMKVATEMMAIGKVQDETSDVGRCIKSVEKKYDNAYTFNEKKFGEKVIKELESKGSCNFTAAIMRLGLKMQEKEK